MAEKDKDLGSTPENHLEGEPHVCPACKREFKGIKDYPKALLSSVSIITPDDVPSELPSWHKEHLLEAPKEGWNRELVPSEVLEYFCTNPDENKLVHSDSFIYHKPVNEKGRYERQFNHAPILRALIEQNVPLGEYLESLQQMTGQEVRTREIFPQWEQDSYFHSAFEIPSEDTPNSGGYLIHLSENEQEATEHRVVEVGIWGQGPNLGSAGGPTIQQILEIGSLHYEGRVNHS